MAEPSTNNIATMLENLLRILKEEHVFDRSGDQRVIQFLHPEELQVNITRLNIKKLASCSLICIYLTTLHLIFFVDLFYTYAEMYFTPQYIISINTFVFVFLLSASINIFIIIILYIIHFLCLMLYF